jgi:hypothetical protein
VTLTEGIFCVTVGGFLALAIFAGVAKLVERRRATSVNRLERIYRMPTHTPRSGR